ncbi:N,N'-diacetylchitobiose phosphorylase [Clostridium ljungdahlii DSM 13528]|uniref:Cyclic beta 1-2 glucan synthetase n=1 Tax=Clostridium ljungdahlii (strain ATCC 55383 / DSM 13528 / PETC) TaxID=748727 RepID=D8GUH8_CLOLD|nr:glucoamylase family protein [Clostridium ljungdahlii]ADK16855.1 cyclic beta 1-2 glucan synthetase [Clostridium ljungdahlii DSM 13528]OAA85600.1 N,N'-diacetylchitobiose phosphorylase [Clostridium ljungdahlii DSM 13528]
MLYIVCIIGIGIILLLMMTYSKLNRVDCRNENVGEDISTLIVDREELKKYAREISTVPSAVQRRSCKKQLIKSLDKSYGRILAGYNFFDEEIKDREEIVSCAEWLLDNLYLVKKEYKDIKNNMSEKYYKNLPVMTEGTMKGFPRIYYIAREMLSKTQGTVKENTIETFINAYQENTILRSGELWAIPIMIRIALIQNISSITDRMVFMQKERKRAKSEAEDIINSKENENEIINKLKDKNIKFTPHFTEGFIKTLRDNFIRNAEIYNWIDEELDKEDSSVKRMVNINHQKQGICQISMENSISGMVEISALNWKENFERLSYVEEILKMDPAGIYSEMDFKSKDYYRHRIEKMSKNINIPESFIAKKAIECAKEACGEEYEKHVGYYLIDKGISCLEKKIKNSTREYKNLHYKARNKITVNFYIGSIVFGTIFLDALISGINFYVDNLSLWKYILGAIVLFIPLSDIFISIFNWSVNKLVKPRFIPKIEFRDGVPEKFSTVVVIPAIINDIKQVKKLIGDIEVYYLANEEKNLYFALLGDFKDSLEREEKDDKLIVDTALNEIEKLNKQYSQGQKDKFYFLSRFRKYNEKEGKWIGWERKRGKLMEFNSLIRGSDNTSYDVISGDIKNLYDVKYVITLDADTKLPKDTARFLIGAMAHPLNIPYLNRDGKKVIRGHGLMQPRVSVSVLSANKTLHSSIFSGETGIDVYTNAISDVYEDLFDEGIFTGKGIYDVDVFNSVLKGEIPENSVLSHDLLEGSYTRAALVTDIELVDGYPAYYNTSCKRLHRWVRGDWQLLPWLFKKSSLNRLSKWKIIDNLRRSIIAPSVMVLIIVSMTLFKNLNDFLVVAFVSILSPILFDVSETVVSPIRGNGLSGKISNFKTVVEQFFLILSFLPYQAYLMLDAIIRTLYRLFISKKNLLQWQTAADAEATCKKGLESYLRSMWIGSALGIIIAFLGFRSSVEDAVLVVPSCIIWIFSPWIAFNISNERKNTEEDIHKEEKDILRRLGRETWAYFEDFISPESNWLSPDNYQEEPYKGVAYRTSPTNMAMGISSNIVAYDLGYIGIKELIYRLHHIISNMESLERYRGHFYNWYDIKNKVPLRPRFISTVDSGNLVAYMWLTEESLEEYMSYPIINKNLPEGFKDTLKLAQNELYSKLKIEYAYGNFIDKLSKNNLTIFSLESLLQDLNTECVKFIGAGKNLYWNEKVKNMTCKFMDELNEFFPWIYLINENEEFHDFRPELNELATKIPLRELPEAFDKLINLMDKGNKKDSSEEENRHKDDLKKLLLDSKLNLCNFISNVKNVIEKLRTIDEEHNFNMLYSKKRQLFAIGYDVEKDTIGKNYYDLLASEARQASFVSIAKGEIKQNHWFNLGRSMASMGGGKALVSWSGTMFEYLMPLIIMKSFPNTLLSETYEYVVKAQKKYGEKRRVPWGISESAYYDFDINSIYQYKAFGIPAAGLKRGLINELVIAPYASLMALQVDFKSAFYNVKNLIKSKAEGRYGFYEAIDYTRERLARKQKCALVKCFMIHHQGMSFMSLDNVLMENVLQERFHRIPRVKSAELLLQEKIPKNIIYNHEEHSTNEKPIVKNENVIARKFTGACTEIPVVNIISSNNYSMMITNSGSGYSKRGNMTIYRWREDATKDDTGMFFYIKNINSNEYWSAAYEPCEHEGEEYEVVFSPDKSEFRRKDGNLRTYTEVTVCQEEEGEVRRISITNTGEKRREVEITSYMEVTLSPYNADLVHPAFQKLFIETEFIHNPVCLLASRRPRKKDEKRPWLVQTIALEGEQLGSIQYETSRVKFIGRNRNLRNPRAMDNDVQLTKSVGAVIDPVISIRVRIAVDPGKTCKVAYTTAITSSREKAIEIANKYRDMFNVNRIFKLSWTESQMEMKYLGIKSNQINMYQKMASRILFLNSSLEQRKEYIMNIRKGQSALWAYGISGDLPIVLAVIRNENHMSLVRQLLSAHEYWMWKGLSVDLVFINLQDSSYMQPLQNKLGDAVNSKASRYKKNIDGGIFLYNKDTMKKEDIELLIGISKLVIDGDKGELFEQIEDSIYLPEGSMEKIDENTSLAFKNKSSYHFQLPELQYFNEVGGFSSQGKSYIIVLKDHNHTPVPWINVISNKKFGFHISESGTSYTWSKNSRENKLTTWSNDPVMDGESESIYLRDEVTGQIWSISPEPIRDSGQYVIEHGFGYSNFKHEANGIVGEMDVFADMNESVKVFKIKLRNISGKRRKISVTYYAKLVLGVCHEQTAQYICTGFNKESEYIYARNPYSEHFNQGICYMKILGGEELSYTASRKEFIGRGGDISKPKALECEQFSNKVGAGFDPCLAENVKVELDTNSEEEVLILFGEEDSSEEVRRVVEKYSSIKNAYMELEKVQEYWSKLFGTIQVDTPDESMNIMLNGWLMYQIIACRYWARTAFYQSGGAYGFRDQLQDVMAICYIDPSETRKHIIYSASRQYLEGDVQHWWHPFVESGIRTRFSDDLLWLPYVVEDYIQNTGDYSILSEKALYLEDTALQDGEDERYNISNVSEKSGTIYEHCIKAIEKSLKFGSHNIPLIGSGDWNDGMSTVGNKGQGESVWLGWFLYNILDKFIPICTFEGDVKSSNKYSELKEFIRENIEENAWDGGWYRRAYFDDGTPLGSAMNEECQIDSISQSWAVISGAAKESRAKEAMEALERNLIRRDKGIILLLSPAFDKSDLEPGYIKGYVPGVRENGGQYTHAAIWSILALSKMGYNNKAYSAFSMINPINHSNTYLNCQVYKVEPYVMAADVYAVEPHTGRGGWSWYTGAAGWMYRTGIESILGMKFKEKLGFTVSPCIPDSWNGFSMKYTRGKCIYNIQVLKDNEKGIWLDGNKVSQGIIPFLREGEHEVKVYM